MPNFHPPLTAFPVVLMTVVLVLEGISFFRPEKVSERMIRYFLMAAGLSIGAAFVSGYWASESANQTFVVSDEVIDYHHSVGRLLLFLIVPCIAVRWVYEGATHGRVVLQSIYRLLLVGCWVLTIYTGYLGGELVFTYGAGVSATP